MKKLQYWQLKELMEEVSNGVTRVLNVRQLEPSSDDICDFDNGGCFGVDNLEHWQDEYLEISLKIKDFINEVEDGFYDHDENKERSKEEIDNAISLITSKLKNIAGIDDIDFMSYHQATKYWDISYYLDQWDFSFIDYAIDKAIKEVAR